MNQTINIGFGTQQKVRYFLLLSHNERHELFFTPLWGSRRPKYFYDGIDQSERNISNIDHISFHQDGTIHLVSYVEARRREVISHAKLRERIADLPSNGYIALMVFSVYDFAKAWEYVGQATPLKYKQTSETPMQKNVDVHWDIEDTNKFSLVFFVLGRRPITERPNIKELLETRFPSVFNIGATLCIEDYMGDETGNLSLAIAYTTRVISAPRIGALMGPKKSREVRRAEHLYGYSLVASDAKINGLV